MFIFLVTVQLLFFRLLGNFLSQDVPNYCFSKQIESRELSAKEDSFSKLPDELLCQILYFLPTTKDVVRTSILAKRWKLLWTFAGNLVLDSHLVVNSGDDLARKLQFCKVVYEVMQRCKPPSLRKIYLDCSNLDCNADDISNWIHSSLAHNVNTLGLKMRGFEMFKLPQSLFKCETLVQFTLHGGSIVGGDVPKVPFFPILQKLEVQSTHFEDEFCFQDLISGCSTLQYLSASVDPRLPRCNIFSPTLKQLHLRFCDFKSEIPNHKAVYINAPALEMLRISGKVRRDIFVKDLSSLVKAIISIDYHNIRDIKFIQGLFNVKFLRWGDPHVKRAWPLTSAPALPVEFHNLIELAIDLCEMNLLKNLMDKSKNLEVISLFQPPFSAPSYDLGGVHEISWIEPNTVPDCLLSRVRKITITGYPGKHELHMIRYLLKNAKVLKMLELHPKKFNPESESELHMLQKIAEYPRGSATCEITFGRP